MAYLKLKDFKKVIEDATRAITMKPGYLKAFHRRGKAYHALKQHEEAIKDFQYILEEEPDNADVNKDLKESRRCLNDKLNKEPMVSEIIDDEPVTAPKIENKFKRVVIEEDSDEEDEEPKIEDVTGSAPVRQIPIVSKFPLKTAKDIEAHTREAKEQMKQGAIVFKTMFDENEKLNQQAMAKKEEKIDSKPETYDSVINQIDKEEKQRQDKLKTEPAKLTTEQDRLEQLQK